MTGIRKIQVNTPAKFGAPLYKSVHYDTVEEFTEYIASPDYQNR